MPRSGSDFFFQLMFCATTASIVSGTLAERIKLWPFLIFVVVLTGLIYPIQASAGSGAAVSWMRDGLPRFRRLHRGAFGRRLGRAGGRADPGPADRQVQGRQGDPDPGFQPALATLGTFILWLGWFGFNGGSQLATWARSVTWPISAASSPTPTWPLPAGAVAALILTQVLYKKPT
jgi:Amt family ammonium transporter